jgi:hypothetical protein
VHLYPESWGLTVHLYPDSRGLTVHLHPEAERAVDSRLNYTSTDEMIHRARQLWTERRQRFFWGERRQRRFCGRRSELWTERRERFFWGEVYDRLHESELIKMANARSKDLFECVATPGECEMLKQVGFIPVIGRETGKLALLEVSSNYNLIRFNPYGWLGFEVCCVQPGLPAPSWDCAATVLLLLRSRQEHVVWRRANRAFFAPHHDTILAGNYLVFRKTLRAMESVLRAAADERCADLGCIQVIKKRLARGDRRVWT